MSVRCWPSGGFTAVTAVAALAPGGSGVRALRRPPAAAVYQPEPA